MLRKSADDFLTQAAMTDAGLLFPPSQIALTAILNSASRAGLNVERYVTCSLRLDNLFIFFLFLTELKENL